MKAHLFRTVCDTLVPDHVYTRVPVAEDILFVGYYATRYSN